MKHNIFRLFIMLALMWAVSSCAVKKYIPDNETLIKKYGFDIPNKPDEITISELRSFIKPSPNKQFLFWQPKLHYYFRNKAKPTKFYGWLDRTYGEEPVYSEEDNIDKISRKMKIYLANIGFFNSEISYDIKKKRGKDRITFKIDLAEPYRLSKIAYDVVDSSIMDMVNKNLAKTLITKGIIYNAYTLDDERDRITEYLRNAGYYFFSRNYIQFEVDSNHMAHEMDIVVKVNNIKEPTDIPGVFNERNHNVYYVNEVVVVPDMKAIETQKIDTTIVNINFWDDDAIYNYNFYYGDKKKIIPSAFNQTLKIKPGKVYSTESVKDTYRRLFNYQIIRTANISFDTAVKNKNIDEEYLLNCKIGMQKSNLNTFSIETEGTNSSGDLGIRGNLIFLNRNIFRRAEVLRIRLNGGFEAQSIKNEDGGNSIFKTFEAGIEGSIFFPRFFSPIKLHAFNQKYNPTSILTFGFNYQVRPKYSRNITLLNLGYSWNQNSQVKHIITPANINFVKVNPTPEFEEELEDETNKRLKEQYSDHMILGLNYSFIYSNQKRKELRNFEYFRANIETSGNLLYGINSLFGTKRSSEGYYEFFGVRYSQYIRVDFDFRQYYKLRDSEKIFAWRFFVGSGIPYLNSEEIPYERGFYSGGANGMRGWAFRTLGPGSYSGTDQDERIGDFQLELSLEYRFPIYKWFHGAAFLDFGNIWTYNSSETFPGGQLKLNSFYKEFAGDMGLGARFDFQFFIFRLDFAAPFIDPSYPEGGRWRLDYMQFKDIIINFGIGYPF